MGCGGSSASGGHKKPKLDMTMEYTKIPEFDTLFQSVAEPLQTLLEVRGTLNKAKHELERFTGTRKRLKDPTFTDTVMGMMYCYAASCNGNFSELEFRPQKSMPYINVKKSSLKEEFRKIPNGFEEFVEKLVKVPEKLAPLVGQIKEAAERCAEFPSQVKNAAGNCGLGPLEIPGAISRTASNVNKLTKAPQVLEEARKSAEDLLKSLLQCMEMLMSDQSTMDSIKEVGKKAHAQKCFIPEEIVGRFWPDQSRVLPVATAAAGHK